ncbi:hypothetical protein [Miniphocaeibacter halophilus]|uniref:Uncharacterized protein n=1 Tax=Miniphocaeibacter halophilus TaxID=2931922 RepID=A0AC61MPF2_9FIRM|nr:hypothetical protein [Miniphocaeibacter halophilus]QQK07356.1 hypothetical protein JFY71_08525 [Miniphocaeibacter halophilus]
MDNFIKEIVELDKSINNLDNDFNKRKNELLVEFNKKKENLYADYNKEFNINLENYKEDIEREVERQKVYLKERNNIVTNKIMEAFEKNKDLICNKVFEQQFSKESD